MRPFLVLLALAGLTAPALADIGPVDTPAGPVTVRTPDGVTAKIVAPEVYDGGAFDVEVTVYRDLIGWTQVRLGSSLRIFVQDAEGERSVLSQYFYSSASRPVTIHVPAGVVPPGVFVDTFVTFSQLEGNPVPTSHVNPTRNALIDQGQFDLADWMDFHGNTRGVSPPAAP